MNKLIYALVSVCLVACRTVPVLEWPRENGPTMTGSAFFGQASAMNWQERDSLALRSFLSGAVPDFLKKFKPVSVSITDSSRRIIRATYYVAPDYLALGTDQDWARVPLTPMAAQRIADRMRCFLPTRKMVDDIYKAAVVTPEPVPLYAFRDSTPTLWHHHLIIEGQRQGRDGLIAGIKKDVVLSEKVARDARPNRVAIYGWHRPDGKPIQPLYTGHVNWYVDYSHGIRLVYRKLKVAGKWMDYEEVLRHPTFRKLLCDEESCEFMRYPY